MDDWWHKMVFPVRRVWFAVSARVKARKKGAGLLKPHDDIQTCGYEDVQVMWETLRKTETEVTSRHHKRKRRPLWRIFIWSSNSSNSSFSSDHAHQSTTCCIFKSNKRCLENQDMYGNFHFLSPTGWYFMIWCKAIVCPYQHRMKYIY